MYHAGGVTSVMCVPRYCLLLVFGAPFFLVFPRQVEALLGCQGLVRRAQASCIWAYAGAKIPHLQILAGVWGPWNTYLASSFSYAWTARIHLRAIPFPQFHSSTLQASSPHILLSCPQTITACITSRLLSCSFTNFIPRREISFVNPPKRIDH
ncbi:hypothetical protein F4803DRAFT_28243 [Xylaria telfairii]|nr:hypothetical protein F4803DRAFT_28243 [Xylaria telfairii]